MEQKPLTLSYDQPLKNQRTFVIESAQKTQGLLYLSNTDSTSRLTLLPFRAKDAVASMIKRLAHRNANVQLYTLEVRLLLCVRENLALTAVLKLANACSQNCGPKMHRELASRSFTDALLRLAGDRVRCQITYRQG